MIGRPRFRAALDDRNRGTASMMGVPRPITLLAVLLLAPVVRPDAVVITRAMTASTIAEVFVEEDQVRVEIEIGVADLRAFGNLLPDEIRERMGLAAEPLQERLPRFFTEDWTIRVDDHTRL